MKKLIALAALVLLTSCESAPEGYQPKAFAFGPAIRVNAREIRVNDNSTSSRAGSHVEQDFPTPLAVALKQWTAQRLVATPDNNAGTMLEITIDDASAVATKLPIKKGVEGMFYDQQDTRYDARIKVTMRLYTDGNAMSVADGDVEVTRSRSINEKATVAQREQMFDQMAHDMLTIYDQQAELRLRQYFGSYLK